MGVGRNRSVTAGRSLHRLSSQRRRRHPGDENRSRRVDRINVDAKLIGRRCHDDEEINDDRRLTREIENGATGSVR